MEDHRVRNRLRRGMGGEVHTDGEQRPHLPIAKRADGPPTFGAKNQFFVIQYGRCLKWVLCAQNEYKYFLYRTEARRLADH